MCLASFLAEVCAVAEESAFSLCAYLFSHYPDVPYSKKIKFNSDSQNICSSLKCATLALTLTNDPNQPHDPRIHKGITKAVFCYFNDTIKNKISKSLHELLLLWTSTDPCAGNGSNERS